MTPNCPAFAATTSISLLLIVHKEAPAGTGAWTEALLLLAGGVASAVHILNATNAHWFLSVGLSARQDAAPLLANDFPTFLIALPGTVVAYSARVTE